MKYKVTNVSMHSDKGARNVFLTEAGKLLKAGDSISCNRIDNGTWGLEKAGFLKIEEGNFPQAPIFTDKPKPVEEDMTETGPRPEDVVARKVEAAAMDRRIATAKVAEEALAATRAAAAAANAEVIKEAPVVPSAGDQSLPAVSVGAVAFDDVPSEPSVSSDAPVVDPDAPAATGRSKKFRGSKF